ncbi:mini-chromosome maintenance complex-binding protein-like [Pollicipes pollicipes]|uniref:mini-chromosome maintenance complex-binding protein-like n=1 Tax=Pollicipes pollicipes TaxID=41117 RepID=UPI0018855D7F|nr:mini-chromosome maintenance complex-binding protein-like [Pollicipes pollicipes]
MVQDMHDPEFYLRAYGVRGPSGAVRAGCGRYRDVVDCGADEQLDPALSRGLEEEEEDCEMEAESEDVDKKFKEEPAAAAGRGSDATAAQGTAAAPPTHGVPPPDADAMVCLVKIYGDEHRLSLNDMVEFVGVLTLDPTLAAAGDAEDAMDAAELAAHNPPPSLAPRLHAVAWRKLEHSNPLLEAAVAATASSPAELAATRRELVTVLRTALLGDALAAELLLCHLLSSVYVRRDVMALGKFALNLARVPATGALPERLFALLERLTEKALFVPLSLGNMNGMTLVPKKDYKRNVLDTGRLQLTQNTHLVLDETALSPGQLDERGVQNLAALGHLITWQKVEYDFGFHKLAYVADVPVLVLSEGRSLLPSDCRVPLEPTEPADRLEEQHRALDQYLTPPLLQQIRRYLTVARCLPYAVPERLQATVQQEFVSWRQQAGGQVKAEDLHQLLVLARLLSLSRGQTELTEEVWQEARRLDEQRRQRAERLEPAPVAA